MVEHRAPTSGVPTVLVVGAGIVGMATAVTLQRQGCAVTVIDRGEPGRGCSFGNAGVLTRNECLPFALPGMARQAPRWLLDPLGPLAVWPLHLPKMAGWAWRLLREATARRAEEMAAVLRQYLSPSVNLYRELLGSMGRGDLLRETGYLTVYESEDAAAGDRFAWDLQRRNGVGFHAVGDAEIRSLVPALDRSLRYGILVPEEGYVTDPFGVVQAFATDFVARGGTVIRGEVAGFTRDGGIVTAAQTSAGLLRADHYVIAAGAWSQILARQFGIRLWIESMRGYHVMLPEPGIELRLPVMFGGSSGLFFATPMAQGLRLAGTAEFAGLDRAPNYARADKLLALGRRMLPGLRAKGASRWMGHRPMTPDTLPIIDRPAQLRNLVFACGHGHFGLSGAPQTGRLVADLLFGRPLPPYARYLAIGR